MLLEWQRIQNLCHLISTLLMKSDWLNINSSVILGHTWKLLYYNYFLSFFSHFFLFSRFKWSCANLKMKKQIKKLKHHVMRAIGVLGASSIAGEMRLGHGSFTEPIALRDGFEFNYHPQRQIAIAM